MSKIFYDKYLVLEKLSVYVADKSHDNNEKEELWKIVDELIHHRLMGCILDTLPRQHHEEFLDKFTKAPFDEELMSFLNGKSKKDIKKLIQKEAKKLEDEILDYLKTPQRA